MIEIFFCPNVLNIQFTDDPQEFEKNHIKYILFLKKTLCEHGIVPRILIDTVKRYQRSAPWDRMQDQSWRKYLLDWQQFVFPFLEKYLFEVSGEKPEDVCNMLVGLEPAEKNSWNYFICNYDSENDLVGSVLSCNSCNAVDCHSFHVFKESNIDIKSINNILYPWLNIYHKDLPPTGGYPFIPPKGWFRHGEPHRGNQNGYIDDSGNEWVPDTERKDHWDVQLKNGRHINVNYDGEIIS